MRKLFGQTNSPELSRISMKKLLNLAASEYTLNVMVCGMYEKTVQQWTHHNHNQWPICGSKDTNLHQ